MTLNEKIAKKMGWKHYNEEYSPTEFYDPKSCMLFNLYDLAAAKLLQQKMVDDGWRIEIINWKHKRGTVYFDAKAENDNGDEEIIIEVLDEPVSLVSIFCKVYGLEV